MNGRVNECSKEQRGRVVGKLTFRSDGGTATPFGTEKHNPAYFARRRYQYNLSAQGVRWERG